jgi:hypothetical protein
MKLKPFGVRMFLGSATVLLAVAAGSASAAYAPQPAPLVVGIDSGGGPYFAVYDAPHCIASVNGCWLLGWLAAYDFTQGGLNVAAGDVTGDGRADVVTAPGRGGRGDVRAFDGAGAQESSFYADSFNGGHVLALGDVNGDGRLDYVLGNDDWSGPYVQVIDGSSGRQLGSFDPGYGGGHGVRVAAGDVNGDGRAEIVTATAPGLSPRVTVWPGTWTGNPRPLRDFAAFDSSATPYGVHVAAGDLNDDGRAEIAAVALTSQGTELRVFDGTGAVLTDVFPFSGDSVYADSLRVAVGDVNGDGTPDLIVAGDTGTGPEIEVLTATGTALFTIPGVDAGESLAIGDVTGDGKPDIVVGDGPGSDPHVTVFSGAGKLESTFGPYGQSFTNGVRVAAGDFNGDGGTGYVAGHGPGGSSEVDLFDANGKSLLTLHPFAGGASDGVYVAAADVDGDRHADLVVGADSGGEPRVSVYDRSGHLLSSFLAFESGFTGGVRVAAGDLDGDGKAEIVVGSGAGRPAEVRIFSLAGKLLRTVVPFDPFFTGGVYPAVGDLNGDGLAEIAVGAGAGGNGLVRTFDGSGNASASFQPYGDTSAEVRVGIGDVLGNGLPVLFTASGRVAPATVDLFGQHGAQLGSFLVNGQFQGGLYVGAQQPLGRPLAISQPSASGFEGRTVSLSLPVTDPDGLDAADDLAATIAWGDHKSSRARVVGSSAVILGSHRYRTAGTYTVSVRVVDRLHRIRIVSGLIHVVDLSLEGHGLVIRYPRSGRFAGVVARFRDGNRLARPAGFVARVWIGGAALSVGARVERIGPGRFVVRLPRPVRLHGNRVAYVGVDDRGGSQVSMRTVFRP